MKAIRINEYGEPEVLRLEDVDLREPKPGEVRVRLRAAGANFVDIYQRCGDYPVLFPFTAGNEGAGIMIEIEDLHAYVLLQKLPITLRPSVKPNRGWPTNTTHSHFSTRVLSPLKVWVEA